MRTEVHARLREPDAKALASGVFGPGARSSAGAGGPRHVRADAQDRAVAPAVERRPAKGLAATAQGARLLRPLGRAVPNWTC